MGLFLPSLEDSLKELGFEVVSTDAPSRRSKGVYSPLTCLYEIDILVRAQYNSKQQALVIEVKNTINQQKIENFVNKKLLNFKKIFL